MSSKLEYLWFLHKLMKEIVAMTQLCARYFIRSREYKERCISTAITLIESLVELVVVRDRYMAMTVQCHMGYKRICKSLGNRETGLILFRIQIRDVFMEETLVMCLKDRQEFARWTSGDIAERGSKHVQIMAWEAGISGKRQVIDCWMCSGTSLRNRQEERHRGPCMSCKGYWNLSQGQWKSWKGLGRKRAWSFLYFL